MSLLGWLAVVVLSVAAVYLLYVVFIQSFIDDEDER